MRTDVPREEVRELLRDSYDDRVFAVEDDTVWVSGMNAYCTAVARAMAQTLSANDIPSSLLTDDGARKFGGVVFRYGSAA